ncbi:MAG TPA: imidazolonepropionase [Bacilli bacterium]|mgnify:FL=1|nr:imidazolonepropionase [Bacilli bacterium]
MKRLIIHHIRQLVTVSGPNRLRRGAEMGDLKIIENGFLVVEAGKIIALGSNRDYLAFVNTEQCELINGEDFIVLPGFIDSHTHLVHYGSRENDLERQAKGESYLDILKSGGGIHQTVSQTQNASFSQLYEKAKASLKTMLAFGVTTVEAKSGYGLDFASEKKQLEVGKALNKELGPLVVNTFMGAHAFPKTCEHRDTYLSNLLKWMEVFRKEELAEFVDVFCEEGVFSLAETKLILERAQALGYGLKMHADEMVSLGGTSLAVSLNCHSVDHLLVTKDEDIDLLATSTTVATILPLTSFYLNKPMARARFMIDKGCGIAIATDYNPGTSPSENLQLAMQMAFLKGKLTPEEIITAVTINAAVSLGLEKRKGSFEVGKDADLVFLNLN